MICFLSIILFLILGIFSSKYKTLAKEAIDCTFRKATFRKCNSNLDTRLKSKITSTILKKNKLIGKIIYKYFNIISWTFTILLIISSIQISIAGYNYYAYGNCNGPDTELGANGNLCIFDPSGEHVKTSQIENTIIPFNQLIKKNTSQINTNLFYNHKDSSTNLNKIIYAGNYNCPNTKKANPEINKIINKYNTDFTFIYTPLKKEDNKILDYLNCVKKEDSNKLWNLHNELMITKEHINNTIIESKIRKIFNNNTKEQNILRCVKYNELKELKSKQLAEISISDIQGTPKIIINKETFIGPKPKRVYERATLNYIDYVGILIIISILLVLTITIYITLKE